MRDIKEAQDLSSEVVSILFNRLEEKGITCYLVAKKCKLSEAALSYLKSKKNQPKLCTLILIASEFGLDLAEIIKEALHKV